MKSDKINDGATGFIACGQCGDEFITLACESPVDAWKRLRFESLTIKDFPDRWNKFDHDSKICPKCARALRDRKVFGTLYLMIIANDVEPYTRGPFKDYKARDAYAKRHKRKAGDSDSIFPFSIWPDGPEVGCYSGEELEP